MADASAEQLQPLVADDEGLVQSIRAAAAEDPEVWTAPDRDPREDAHGIFSYPAMMVPGVQRALMEAVLSIQPDVRRFVDPFVGAGSSLVAAMPLGLNCTGFDLNPLAALVSRVKTGPYNCASFAHHAVSVVAEARADSSSALETDFVRHAKWFKPSVSVELSRLRRAIRAVPNPAARRFLWVTLAGTVRLTSNDRTTTFKLHARPDDEIERRTPAPVDKFEDLAARHIEDLAEFRDVVAEAGHLHRCQYTPGLRVELHDAADGSSPLPGAPYDLLVTSPPYGDNHTTVPYGQHSFLPLQWMDAGDLHDGVDPLCMLTTKEIDKRSLGGVKVADLAGSVAALSARSPHLATTFQRLSTEKQDRTERVATFYTDFSQALSRIVGSLRPNAYLIITLGNRRVGGGVIPNDAITADFLSELGAVEVTRLKRQILGKRMASRNRTVPTMKEEDILVFRNTTGTRLRGGPQL